MCMLRTGLKSSPHRLHSHTKESKNISISPDSDPFSCVAAFVGRQVCSLGIMLCTVINTIPYFTSKPFRVLQKGQAVYSTMLSCLGSGPLCENDDTVMIQLDHARNSIPCTVQYKSDLNIYKKDIPQMALLRC